MSAFGASGGSGAVIAVIAVTAVTAVTPLRPQHASAWAAPAPADQAPADQAPAGRQASTCQARCTTSADALGNTGAGRPGPGKAGSGAASAAQLEPPSPTIELVATRPPERCTSRPRRVVTALTALPSPGDPDRRRPEGRCREVDQRCLPGVRARPAGPGAARRRRPARQPARVVRGGRRHLPARRRLGPVRDLGRRVAQVATDYQHVVIDTGPSQEQLLRQALTVSDAFLIPAAPSLIDVREVARTLQLPTSDAFPSARRGGRPSGATLLGRRSPAVARSGATASHVRKRPSCLSASLR